jgi:4-hydroxybutyryl-CoA dehydratase/vinylacetyl-CoA-Delta-isomerase
MKILRLIENMGGGTALVESMHGAGSSNAKVMYGRLGILSKRNAGPRRL